ncbi:MAG: glycosyltransferase family 2 protein [Hungatella sp.]|nr:glycosyltransferase family 2 protein [Hungatella sp.]
MKENTDRKVTVIIPNYNGLSFMEPCMAALDKQRCQNFDILVVDNGSTDGSGQWLREHKIPTIFLETNTGFSGAVNVGIRAVRTPYVLLLNNDTEPEPDFVGELLRSISRSKKIFAVSSKMAQLFHRDLMDSAGDMYSVLGWAYQRGVGQSSRGFNRPREVFSACGGAAIYRREVFDIIGYFDEKHFAYLEDIDICYRAKIFGYHNLYCPTAVVYHVGSGTSGSKYNSFKVRLAARNGIYLNYKNMPWPQLAVNSLPLALGILVKYGFFKKLGFEKDYVQGIREGFATMRTCKKVAFRREHLANYLAIQWELMAGTGLYVYEFSKRQIGKACKRSGNFG